MNDKNETLPQPVTADKLDRLFRNAETKYVSNRKRHAKDNDRYARLIALRQIESDYEPRGGASSSSHADISWSVAPARSATLEPGTKAGFAHRLQMNIEALTQKSFRVKLDAFIDHVKKVFKKAFCEVFARSHADISRSVAPARSTIPKPGTKAEFAHRLQLNTELLTKKMFRKKLGAVIDHGKKVFEKALLDDRREMTQQHERLAERVKLLARQRANLTWFYNWGHLGIVGELVSRFGNTTSEGRTSGLARFKAVSEKLQGHAAYLLGDFQPYRSMRAEQRKQTESEDQCDNKEVEARKDAGKD